jgi:4-hydroxymandelate oxidase
MKDIRAKAKELMAPYCKVCPVCDGRACSGEVPGMGGLGTGTSFTNNVKALAALTFNMRLIHSVTEPDTSSFILGKKLSVPVLAAPIGGVSFNMGGAISENEYINAIIDGCKAQGIIGCTGDGVPDFIHQAGFAAIQNSRGHGIPFIKPWSDKELFQKIEALQETGCDTMGIDIDAAGLITLKKMGRPVSPRSLIQLTEIIKKCEMKFILKGVMTPEDAEFAVDAGADAIVVSNHGGRVFDSLPGTADVLPNIADKVKDSITILVDGGIRSGGDILKLLALGADAVMIGRPFSIAAMGGLQEGVEAYIEMITGDLKQAMVLTGTASVSAVDHNILFPTPK